MSVIRLKACYKEGTDINGNNSNYTYDEPTYVVNGNWCEVVMNYIRRNAQGLGVRRNDKPALLVETSLKGTTEEATSVQVIDNSDIIHIGLGCSTGIKAINIDLIDMRGSSSTYVASSRASMIEINIGGVFGEVWKFVAKNMLQSVANNPDFITPATIVNQLKIRRNTMGEAYGARYINNGSARIRATLEESNNDFNMTWYQLQYGVLQTTAPHYVDNNTAEAWIRQYDALAAVADEYL